MWSIAVTLYPCVSVSAHLHCDIALASVVISIAVVFTVAVV